MENEVRKYIIDYATKKLNSAYGYCGVVEGKEVAMTYSQKPTEMKMNGPSSKAVTYLDLKA